MHPSQRRQLTSSWLLVAEDFVPLCSRHIPPCRALHSQMGEANTKRADRGIFTVPYHTEGSRALSHDSPTLCLQPPLLPAWTLTHIAEVM